MSGTDHLSRLTGCRSAVAHRSIRMERTSHQGNVGQNDHIGTLCLLLFLLLGNGRDAVDNSVAPDADCTWISGALDADGTWIIGVLDVDCIMTRVPRSVALCQQIIVVTFFFKTLGVHRASVVTLEYVLGFSCYIA